MWPWGQLSEREQKVTGNVLERECTVLQLTAAINNENT
jgi:hypothetical protein